MTSKYQQLSSHANMMTKVMQLKIEKSRFKNIALTLPLLLASANGFAQTTTPVDNKPLGGESEYQYADAVQLWRQTQNAAGMTIDSLGNRGYAAFGFMHQSGDFHRVQEGGQTNNITFFTERYQHIGKYLYGYGSFRFDNGRTKDRAWSDVMRTYDSDPFISGSSVFGKYDTQQFALKARLASVAISNWRFGIGLNYTVGDLSRLRDPRSRSRYLDYQLTPSVNYTFGRHTIGLAGWYQRYKEKIPNITTVQQEPNLYYYQMSGLEAVNGAVGAYQSYQREYVNHDFGGELTYGYHGEKFQSVTALSIERGSEGIYEQYKREPGHYTEYNYAVTSQNRIITDGAVHHIDFAFKARQGYADEYRPQMVITTDSVHGYTSTTYTNLLTYKKRYQLKTADVSLHYRLNFTDGAAIANYLGIRGEFVAVSQKHLLPESKWNYNTTDINVEYGQSLLKNRRLWVELNAGRHFSNKADLRLADPTTVYAENVWLVDQDYYNADHWNGTLKVKYQFPLKIKGYRSMWYVGGYAKTVRASHSRDFTTYGITIGIFQL